MANFNTDYYVMGDLIKKHYAMYLLTDDESVNGVYVDFASLEGKHIEMWDNYTEERCDDDEDQPIEKFFDVYNSTEITCVDVVGDAVRMYC